MQITVACFLVYAITPHMRIPHTVADRAMIMIAWILETDLFVDTDENDIMFLGLGLT